LRTDKAGVPVDWFSSDSFGFERSMYIDERGWSRIVSINKIRKVR